MPQPPAKVGGTPPALTDVLTSAAGYAAEEKAAATRRAYRSDWKHFQSWGEGVKVETLPAAAVTVASYLAYLADSGRTASTIARRLAAIAHAHKLAGHEPPTSTEAVNAVMRGIRRRLGTAATQKAPATARTIEAMLCKIGENFSGSLQGKRDQALILLGFAAALRRSELVALTIGDLEFEPDGLLVHIRRSKTDQEGTGATVAIPRGGRLRPVEAVEAWIIAITSSLNCIDCLQSPLFRPIAKGGRIGSAALTDHSVAAIIKRYAAAAGLDPRIFSGHSLRSGFVTSALEHGADIFKVMDVTRHKRVETLKGYDRRAQAFRNHAGKDFL